MQPGIQTRQAKGAVWFFLSFQSFYPTFHPLNEMMPLLAGGEVRTLGKGRPS